MLGPRSSRFHQAALQSGLIDEAGLAACWDLIPPERRTPDAIDRRLARQTISTGRLTLWQAQQLLAGRVSGFQIDKYVLLNLLGRGGMGRVFLAKDNRLNRMVALKLLSQERMNNPRAIARFRREAKVGAQLQHENLVRVYDEGESAGVLYLVMEHIDGKNVGQLIGDLGKIPWPNAARLARQVASGLEHARLKGLIHRDVNPCNILVTHDGTAKLTDLGLAIDLNDLDNVTREGATVGTFDYVSPEQAKNSRSVDTRADLYSLGCTLFHMIAGRVPFPMASLPEKLYAHQLHDPELLTTLVPEVPEGLAEVVRRLMRKLPEDRYQTPAEVAQALEPFAIETGWTATPGMVVAAEGANRSGSGEGPSVVEGSSAGLTALSTSSQSPGVGESFFPLDLGPVEPLAGNLHKSSRARTSSATSDLTSKSDPARPPRRVKVGMVAMIGFSRGGRGGGRRHAGQHGGFADRPHWPRPDRRIKTGDHRRWHQPRPTAGHWSRGGPVPRWVVGGRARPEGWSRPRGPRPRRGDFGCRIDRPAEQRGHVPDPRRRPDDPRGRRPGRHHRGRHEGVATSAPGRGEPELEPT